MKNILYIAILFGFFLAGCKTTQNTTAKQNNKKETVAIKNDGDKEEYDIIIIDNGFKRFLATAQPKSFYSESALEAKNRRYVQIWNERVHNPQLYDPNIYEQEIDYDYNKHYGLDVNYKLYQYFKYLEKELGQRFY